MKALYYSLAVVLAIVWAIGTFVYHAPLLIHIVLVAAAFCTLLGYIEQKRYQTEDSDYEK